MEFTRNDVETAAGPVEWFTGNVYIDAVAVAVVLSARECEQCPLHARGANGLAHSIRTGKRSS